MRTLREASICGLGLGSVCVARAALAHDIVSIAAGRASEIPATQYLDYSVQLPGPRFETSRRGVDRV